MAAGYTKSAKASELKEQWYVIDAKDRILGRVATEIAYVLRGKHMPNYTPHANMRTHVIVLNADKVKLTGDKLLSKTYYWHTPYVGGIKSLSAEKMNEKHPGDLVRRAVQGMLPKNRLGNATMTRLRIFTGDTHNHAAQNPQPLPARTAELSA